MKGSRAHHAAKFGSPFAKIAVKLPLPSERISTIFGRMYVAHTNVSAPTIAAIEHPTMAAKMA
jgi:hypothetical protein